MFQEYFQLGGFRPQLDWYRYDDKKLAEMLAGDKSPLRVHMRDSKDPIELVLGIKRTGSSHLLLTKSQTQIIVRSTGESYPRARTLLSSDFESLSPIYFHNADELSKKLGVLKVKSAKGRVPVDNSQTNKAYGSGNAGVTRGGFEHGRLLFQILQNHIADVEKYSVNDTLWKASLQISSFVFNPRMQDERKLIDRVERPTVLDCGLTNATVPELQKAPGSSVHIIVSNNIHLNRGSQKLKFEHGTTEELNDYEVSTRLQACFKNRTRRSENPMILLVHNEELSRNVLKNHGVDTSAWESGIRNLLGFSTTQGNYSAGTSRYDRSPSSSRDAYDQRRNRARSRSRSPGRSLEYTPYRRPSSSSYMDHSNDFQSRASASTQHCRRDYAPVYIVDIQKLYARLMETDFSSSTIAGIAEYLGLSDTHGWCAGNESALIIDIWRSMISGPPIDEQRAMRMAIKNPRIDTPSTDEELGAPADVDSDADPNDIIQKPMTSAAGDPDSDSDNGESDSD